MRLCGHDCVVRGCYDLGSAGFVTGAIGMTAASVVINKLAGKEIGPN